MYKQWHPVVGYEGWYEVSNHGDVKRVRPGKATRPGGILKQQVGRSGRLKVTLCKNSVQETIEVAKLVALAFIGPRPDGHQINHIDYNCKNNRADNLEFVTPSENLRHAYRHGFVGGVGERQGLSKLTEHDIRLIRRSPLSARMAAAHHNVAPITIKHVRLGNTWKHIT